jgi:hypothetical protein
MNEYIKTFGEPGEPKIRTHILNPGMDVTICGLDAVGDDMIHDKPPESLPRGKRYRVTCEDCLNIIAAVRDHISANVSRQRPLPAGEDSPKQNQASSG